MINWDTIQHLILLESVEECAKSWCEKSGKNDLIVKPWIAVVSEKIRTKISALKKSNYVKEVNEVLRSNECLQSLEELQNQFVIVPIDKASGNICNL